MTASHHTLARRSANAYTAAIARERECGGTRTCGQNRGCLERRQRAMPPRGAVAASATVSGKVAQSHAATKSGLPMVPYTRILRLEKLSGCHPSHFSGSAPHHCRHATRRELPTRRQRPGDAAGRKSSPGVGRARRADAATSATRSASRET